MAPIVGWKSAKHAELVQVGQRQLVRVRASVPHYSATATAK
jgi:hypothetical protein